ncbi:PREDICTED: olfactory receptor 1019-like [Nanorana parkeri]|uniref:olfactory receptor 1019-like n=1 Tax=Nanorana parkeri TaxID=125878 RepID=UPI0008544673|nr:PREDICTED: olfactory receptor 1019-like [Nanorana parkeri]
MDNMEGDGHNQTLVSEFILLGLTDNHKLNILFFNIILLMYFVTIIGNVGMIILICCCTKLHNPMYFFLGNLSFSDLCYSSVITPKLMTNLCSGQKMISFKGCVSQLFFFALFVGAECFLVTVMSYDRYVAICNPLLYAVIMSQTLRVKLVGAAYSGGILTSIIHTSCTFSMTFCGSNKVNHFFCDIPPLLKLSCTNTFISELFMFLLSSTLGGLSATVIMFSYTKIISAILRMQSPEGRQKAFSTCSSHLLVVSLFFGTAIFQYARPISSYSVQKDKVISLIYTVVIPMLNPIIYSLRNAHVKDAFISVIDITTLCK